MDDAVTESVNATSTPSASTPSHGTGRGNDVLVRPAQSHELARVGELTVTAYRAGGPLAWASDESYRATLQDARDRSERGELLVAVDSVGTLLGTVTIARAGTVFAELCRDDELELRMLAVAEQARGRGVGEALTQAVVDRARQEGAHRVVLCSMDTLAPAHRLYRRFGFRRSPERDWTAPPDTTLLAFSLDL